jgi:hypothetical protein
MPYPTISRAMTAIPKGMAGEPTTMTIIRQPLFHENEQSIMIKDISLNRFMFFILYEEYFIWQLNNYK